VSAALAAGVLLGVGAFALRSPAATDSVVDADPVAWRGDAAVEDAARSAVLRADVETCRGARVGSLTLVDRGGSAVGLTNEHVVRDARSVSLSGSRGGSGGESRGRVVGAVDRRDAAFVGVESGQDPLTAGVRPRTGADVLVAGFPGGSYEAVWGTVAGTEERVGRGGTTTMMLIDVQAHPGLSGGAVVDRSGAVVGIVSARDPATGWVVAYPMGELLGRTTDRMPTAC
jgi:S1-C subfamily serine protease